MYLELFVTGCILNIVVKERFVRPLTNTVFLLKENDIVKSDTWRIAIDFNLSKYHEVTSIVKADIFTVQQQGQKFTSISDLKQIKTLLQALESKLYNFRHFLPRLDRRRSQLNFGVTVLKALFGTGTISDLNQLHGVLDELKNRTSDLVHRLTNQITYVKELDTINAINTKANTNFTTIIMLNIVLSRDKFQQITKVIMWLNFNNLM
jgi:hypothetical protein